MIATSEGMLEPAQILDQLDYSAYRFNREVVLMSAEQLARIFTETGDAMEARYQTEINAYANAGVKRDQLARHEGRPEHDRDIAGRALKAGT